MKNLLMPLASLPLSEIQKGMLETVAFHAREDMALGKQVPTIFFVINSLQRKFDIVAEHADDEMAKNISIVTVRQLAAELDADMVMMISEAWSLPEDTPLEKAKALYREYGAIEHMPEAIEMMVVYLQMRDTSFFGTAKITGSGLNKRYGELMFYEFGDKPNHGRISNLIIAPERVAAIEHMLAQLEAKFIAAGVDPHDKLGPRSPLESLALKLWLHHTADLTEAEMDATVQFTVALLAKYA